MHFMKLLALAAPEPTDHQPLPGIAFVLHNATFAVAIAQLAATSRAWRDGIIALNIKTLYMVLPPLKFSCISNKI